VYRTRLSIEQNDDGKVVKRKLLHIWFLHPKLLELRGIFAGDAVCMIDATFNTNTSRIPTIVAVGMIRNNKTFPIAFSYYPTEDHESYSFFWESLKAH
jgi:hypothetical protein